MTYRMTAYTPRDKWFIDCESAEEARKRQYYATLSGAFAFIVSISSTGWGRVYAGLNDIVDTRSKNFPHPLSSTLDHR